MISGNHSVFRLAFWENAQVSSGNISSSGIRIECSLFWICAHCFGSLECDNFMPVM